MNMKDHNHNNNLKWKWPLKKIITYFHKKKEKEKRTYYFTCSSTLYYIIIINDKKKHFPRMLQFIIKICYVLENSFLQDCVFDQINAIKTGNIVKDYYNLK